MQSQSQTLRRWGARWLHLGAASGDGEMEAQTEKIGKDMRNSRDWRRLVQNVKSDVNIRTSEEQLQQRREGKHHGEISNHWSISNDGDEDGDQTPKKRKLHQSHKTLIQAQTLKNIRPFSLCSSLFLPPCPFPSPSPPLLLCICIRLSPFFWVDVDVLACAKFI